MGLCGVWLPVSLPPEASEPPGFRGESCLGASGPLARSRSAEARLKALLRDALRLAGVWEVGGIVACRGLPRERLWGGWAGLRGALGGVSASAGLKLGFTYCPGFSSFPSEVLTAILRVGATKLVGILAPSLLAGGPGWPPMVGSSLAFLK